MTTPSPVLVPGWLVRSGAVGWRILALLGMVVVAGLVLAAIPVSATATLISLVLAAALAPTALRLRAAGRSRTVAAAITFGAAAVLIVGVAILLLVLLVPDLRAVAAAVELGLAAVRNQLAQMGAPENASQILDSVAASIAAGITPDPAAVAGALVTIGTVIVLGTFLTFFLLADGDRGWTWLMRSLRPWQVEAVTTSARDGLYRVAWYVRRTVLLAAVDGVVVGVVLAVLGVPLAGALACVAFIAGFVPYLGAIVGGAIIALAVLALGGAAAACAVLVGLVAGWLVATRLLESTELNRSIDVHPVIVLIAIPTGLALFGILGLFALLPVTVFGLAISRSVVVVLDLGPAGTFDVEDRAGDAPPSPSDLPEGVPVWLDRVAQWSWRALVLAALAGAAITVVVRIPSVVVPAVIAVVAAATLLPVVGRLAGRGWGRGSASALVIAGSSAIIVAICLAALAMTLGPLRAVIETAVAGASSMDLIWLAQLVAEVGVALEGQLAGLFVDMISFAIALVLALLMTFFFLRDGGAWWAAAMARLSPGRRAPMAEAGHRAVTVLSGYMVGTAIISAFGGITSGLMMVVLGLPFALPIAVIGFFFGFIPYVGNLLATALSLLVAIAVGDTSDIVLMVIYTLVFNIVQGNFVTPLVYGRSLSLHPAIVLMAIPVGNEIAGILGMFLVVPAAAMIAATWRLVIAAIDEAGLPLEPEDAGEVTTAPDTLPAAAT
jgi:predicted PurR-regulated permease PerM